MIKFHCKSCGQSISVDNKLAGKRGKCPKCGDIVVVPDAPAKIEFPCRDCGQKIAVPRSYAGKKGRCPNCKSIVIVPGHATASPKSIKTVCFACSACSGKIEVPEASRGKLIECPKCGSFVEVPSQRAAPDEARMPIPESAHKRLPEHSPEQAAEPVAETAEEQTGPTGKRKLPWLIDVFLYPTNKPGLTMQAIFLGVPLFMDVFLRVLNLLTSRFPPFYVFAVFFLIVSVIINIIMRLYRYWYLTECVRESANGQIRAPETIATTPGLGEMLSLFLKVFVCIIIFSAPIYNYLLNSKGIDRSFWSLFNFTLFFLWVVISEIGQSGITFHLLLFFAVFFFPMTLLSVVIFDSFRALNPVLIIGSIFSTFVPYCGLILLLCILWVPVISIRKFSVMQIVSRRTGFFLYLPRTINIYLMLVGAHLLGRFSWKYQNKLNWDV